MESEMHTVNMHALNTVNMCTYNIWWHDEGQLYEKEWRYTTQNLEGMPACRMSMQDFRQFFRSRLWDWCQHRQPTVTSLFLYSQSRRRRAVAYTSSTTAYSLLDSVFYFYRDQYVCYRWAHKDQELFCHSLWILSVEMLFSFID